MAGPRTPGLELDRWIIQDRDRPHTHRSEEAGDASDAFAAALQQVEGQKADRPGLLGAVVDRADAAHRQADAEVERVARGEGNLHEMAIALEKADIEMRLAMRGRDKLVQAYQEIMRMNV